MKIKNRQDFLVVLTLAVVVLWVAVSFIFPPIFGWWSDRQKQISGLRDQLKDGSQMIRRETALRSHWRDMQANALPVQANALPASMPEAEQKFLKAMYGWSRDSGAEITSLAPQWKNEGTNYLTLDCRVESAGDLNALSKFLYDIEKGPMMVRLDSVELSSHDNTGQQLSLGVEINGLALMQKETK
jgi:Tfp pilus assembly protein PilO